MSSPQEDFWGLSKEIVHAYVTDLTTKQAEGFQIVELYRQRGGCRMERSDMDRSARDVPRSGATGGEHQNVFDELKNQWGFVGFCAHKAVVSECAARLLLLIYNLWSMFLRVLKNDGMHTEAITSRCELLLIPGRLTKSGSFRLRGGVGLGVVACGRRLANKLTATLWQASP